MSELFTQLGINVPALIAQAFNFLVVLLVLTIYVYRPLSKMMEERSVKIAAGLLAHEKGEERLREIEEAARARAARSESEALSVIQGARREGELVGKNIVAESEARGAGIVEEARTQAARVSAEELARVEHEARMFVKAVLQKTVELDPKLVDERLIDQAAGLIKSART